MPYQVQTRGGSVIGALGGPTPDELYGVGVWGPAIYDVNNRTQLDAAAASSYDTLDGARALEQVLFLQYPANEYRIIETPTGLLEAALHIPTG